MHPSKLTFGHILTLLLGAVPAGAEGVFSNLTSESFTLLICGLPEETHAIEYTVYPKGRDAVEAATFWAKEIRFEEKKKRETRPSCTGSFNPKNEARPTRFELNAGEAIGFSVPSDPMPAGSRFEVRFRVVQDWAGTHDCDPEISPGLWVVYSVKPDRQGQPVETMSHIFRPGDDYSVSLFKDLYRVKGPSSSNPGISLVERCCWCCCIS